MSDASSATVFAFVLVLVQGGESRLFVFLWSGLNRLRILQRVRQKRNFAGSAGAVVRAAYTGGASGGSHGHLLQFCLIPLSTEDMCCRSSQCPVLPEALCSHLVRSPNLGALTEDQAVIYSSDGVEVVTHGTMKASLASQYQSAPARTLCDGYFARKVAVLAHGSALWVVIRATSML